MAESDKIKGPDLVVPGYLKQAQADALEFKNTIVDLKVAVKDLNKATGEKLKASKGTTSKDLKEQNKLLNESKKQRAALVALEAQELNATIKLNKAKQAETDFINKKTAATAKEIKLMEQQNSAYAIADKRLKQLRNDYRDLAVAGKGADKVTQDILKEITLLDKELKEVDASMGVFTREVGNYKNSMKEALEETGAFSAGMGKLDAQSQALISGLGGVVKQLGELRKAQEAGISGSKKLGNALKIGGIGILLAALASLGSFFSSSREGALELELAMNKFKAGLDVLIRGLVGWGKALVLTFKSTINEISADIEDMKGPLGDSDEALRLHALATQQAAEANDLFANSFKGSIDAYNAQSDALDKLSREIFDYEDELRRLQVTLAKVNMDEEDANAIYADQTIPLNERNAALKEGMRLRREAANINEQIAKKELDIAWGQIRSDFVRSRLTEQQIKLIKEEGVEAFLNSKYTLKANNDNIEALKEKYLATLKANDAVADLTREEGEQNRAFIQETIIGQIELLRSKKLGADSAIQILKDQVADETVQLELRAQKQKELFQAQQDQTLAEIALFETFGVSQAEILDLINEKDAVRLAQRLTELEKTRISTAQREELAKIILEAQNNEIANNKELEKQENEKIKRAQRLIELDRQIAIEREKGVLEDVNNMEAERQRILDESNQTILQNNNVFNQELLLQRQQAADEEAAIIAEQYRIRQDLADRQHEIEKTNIENSKEDEFVKQRQLLLLEEQYQNEKEKLQVEQAQKQRDLAQKEAEQLRQIELKKTSIIIENLQKATTALTEELDKRNEIENANRQRQLDATEARIQKQQDLAARGLENSLAFEEAQREKQLLAQQDAERREAKRKENIALAEALLNAYNSELQQPNANPTTAAYKALADVLIFKGLAAGLVQFAADGNNMIQGPGTTTSDSVPFMLSKGEAVIKASENSKHNDAVVAMNAGMFDKLYMPKYDTTQDLPSRSINAESLGLNFGGQYNKEILDRLDDIASKPTQQIDVDKLGNLIDIRTKGTVKQITRYKRGRI